MNTSVVIMILLCTAVVFGIINAAAGKEKPLKKGFLFVLAGVASFFAVSLTGQYTGINLPVSCFSLLVSGIGGVPGTALLCLLQFIIV